jgi:hypothetical protein
VLTVVTFLGVCLAWIPFRAPDARTGVAVLAAIGNAWSGTTSAAWTALAVMTISVAWQWRMRDTTWEARAAQSSEGVRAAAVAISMVAIFLTSGGDDRAFIYFQF